MGSVTPLTACEYGIAKPLELSDKTEFETFSQQQTMLSQSKNHEKHIRDCCESIFCLITATGSVFPKQEINHQNEGPI